jgi:hypothetical protein
MIEVGTILGKRLSIWEIFERVIPEVEWLPHFFSPFNSAKCGGSQHGERYVRIQLFNEQILDESSD